MCETWGGCFALPLSQVLSNESVSVRVRCHTERISLPKAEAELILKHR